MAEAGLTIVPRLRQLLAEHPDLEDRPLVQAKLMTELNSSVEGAQRCARLLETADALRGRLMTNDFEKRLTALERRLSDLETTK